MIKLYFTYIYSHTTVVKEARAGSKASALPSTEQRTGADSDPCSNKQKRDDTFVTTCADSQGVLKFIFITYVCQHSKMILPTTGSSSFGISSRRFWKPTAPTTCIGFIPRQGNLNVASSQRITPKLYTSHL